MDGEPHATDGAAGKVLAQPAAAAAGTRRGAITAWARRCGPGLLHGLPHVLLLTLVVVVVHGLHLRDFMATEGHFRREVLKRWATAQLSGDSVPRTPGLAAQIGVVEASPIFRLRHLVPEVSDVGDAVLERLDGTLPLDRCKSALLLRQLANRLAAQTAPPHQVRTVAIDFDLAPLDAAAATGPCWEPTEQALRLLRTQATVVAIVMARTNAADRAARNHFWVHTAGCSQARAGPAMGLQPLLLASPQVFHEHHGYPLDFPVLAGKLPAPHAALVGGRYPSLGNLISVAGGQAAADDATAFHLCKQMAAAAAAKPPRHCVLEDMLDGRADSPADQCSADEAFAVTLKQTLRSHMTHAEYNWRLRDSEVYRHMPLTHPDQLAAACRRHDCLGGDLLAAPVLLLGVDAGAGIDKYSAPNITPQQISGAQLHALQHLSQQPRQVLHANAAVAVLADLGLGVLFLLLWTGFKQWLPLSPLPGALQTGLRLLMPLLLALAAAELARRVISPCMLGHDLWFNPVFVLAGMALHAYAEAWHGDTHAAAHGAGHGPDFSFGLWPLIAGLRRRGQPGRGLADAAWAMGLQWLLLLAATCFMVKPGGVHQGLWLAMGLWALVFLGVLHAWYRDSTHVQPPQEH